MTARWWLTPRMRKALVAMHAATRGDPVAFCFPQWQVEQLVGKNAGNVIDGMVRRGLLERQTTVFSLGQRSTGSDTPATVDDFNLSPAGVVQAERLIRQLERRERHTNGTQTA